VAEPKGRAYVLSARAYLTELRRRQGDVWGQEMTLEAPPEYDGLTVDEINVVAADKGLRNATPYSTALRERLAQREGTKWYKLENDNRK
jgi:hypothetical protein